MSLSMWGKLCQVFLDSIQNISPHRSAHTHTHTHTRTSIEAIYTVVPQVLHHTADYILFHLVNDDNNNNKQYNLENC